PRTSVALSASSGSRVDVTSAGRAITFRNGPAVFEEAVCDVARTGNTGVVVVRSRREYHSTLDRRGRPGTHCLQPVDPIGDVPALRRLPAPTHPAHGHPAARGHRVRRPTPHVRGRPRRPAAGR